jgi:glycosyltransferase involved in cell wall biosynthesis
VRICVISTTVMTCPPPGYSGLEMLAWQQADRLAHRKHQVTLIAPHGSSPPKDVELHGTTVGEPEQQAYSGYWQKLPTFDAVIDNSWQKWSYMLKTEGKLKAPVLGVLHAPVETMFGSPPPVKKPCLVAISKDQAGAVMGHLGVAARVAYNGIDLDFYKPTGDERGNRYLFLARISKLKGPHIALEVAKRCKVGLDLVGDDVLVEDQGYVKRIREFCDNPKLVYHGGKPRAQCPAFFSMAKALLHLNFVYREPFGLSPIESMACGTPVISGELGAMRETVKHGETGFLVRTTEEVEELVKSDAVATIKPERCREWASQFSIQRMGERYDELVKEAVESGGW